jgi:NAD(P)-dependent dehydrogenase (short-subunit alcohol dehydrogenase family)
MAQRLAGKVALVTGSGSGIGQGCALQFAREGCVVVGCDIDDGRARSTVELAQDAGLQMTTTAPADLTEPAAAPEVVAEVVSRHGGLDVLVNAAATAVFAPIEALRFEDWRATLAAEVDSVFLLCQAAWSSLVDRGGGSIINFASANARVALDGSPALAHCAGKGAVLAMTRQLAMEGGPHAIRANTISPGLVVTGATRPALETRPELSEKVMAKLMIKRLGQPLDIALLATYLASDESSWVTGSDFAIDGGATAW